MLIGKKYKIESDKLNIIVSSRSIARKGKNAGHETWTPEGYFSTLESALRWLVDHEIKGTELIDIKIVIEKQKKLYELLRRVKDETLTLSNRCSQMEQVDCTPLQGEQGYEAMRTMLQD